MSLIWNGGKKERGEKVQTKHMCFAQTPVRPSVLRSTGASSSLCVATPPLRLCVCVCVFETFSPRGQPLVSFVKSFKLHASLEALDRSWFQHTHTHTLRILPRNCQRSDTREGGSRGSWESFILSVSDMDKMTSSLSDFSLLSPPISTPTVGKDPV